MNKTVLNPWPIDQVDLVSLNFNTIIVSLFYIPLKEHELLHYLIAGYIINDVNGEEAIQVSPY